jgi:hypothetical protein
MGRRDGEEELESDVEHVKGGRKNARNSGTEGLGGMRGIGRVERKEDGKEVRVDREGEVGKEGGINELVRNRRRERVRKRRNGNGMME